LNDAVLRNPEAAVRLGQDHISVDGRAIHAAARIYLMLNKPRGAVTTAADERGRPTVYQHLGDQGAWVAPVGRLDKASEGLLLLTNDSEWAAQVLAPETHLEKIYHVQISARATQGLLESLRRGIHAGGDFLRATRVDILRHGARNSWLEFALDEGKNRHIRRMLQALGVEVLRLVRVSIGPLALGDLPKGAWRELTQAEKHALNETLRGKKEKS
jgi:23S rRNA pseudouridine2605 synthase